MAEVDVTRNGDGTWRVEVRERGGSTAHTVTATPEQVRRYGGDVRPERLLEASFRFLLEREPKEAILDAFELPVIERYFPDYPDEIRRRLA